MFNVLTANTIDEGKELIQLMPVHAIIVHERALAGYDPSDAIVQLRKIRPDTPVVLLSPNPVGARGADRVLSSHDPVELVRVLRQMFNLPADPAAMEPQPRRRV